MSAEKSINCMINRKEYNENIYDALEKRVV